jgi:Ca2+-binding RTX toxin-like protein
VLVVCGAMVAAFLATVSVADAAAQRCLGKKATIVGTAKADKIKGTAGADVIAGLNGNDVISGLGGNDLICGGDGKDKINGGAGDDRISGGDGNDTISGNAGVDTADFSSSPEGVYVELPDGTAEGAGSDKLSGIENLVGSRHSDVLVGTGGDNSLLGSKGADLIVGRGGNDTLDGGAGLDFVDYEFSPAGVAVSLSTGRATGEGTDRLANFEAVVGSAYDDTLIGNDQVNVIVPLGGTNAVDGGPGEDIVDYEASPAGVVVDLTTGTATGPSTDTLASIEHVIGSGFDDTIIGNAAGNSLIGLFGSDTMSGGDGNDSFLNLDGNDTVTGGSGLDSILVDGTNNKIDGGPNEDMVDFMLSPTGVVVDLTAGTATGGVTATLAHIEDVTGSWGDDTLIGNDLPNWFMPLDGDDSVDGGSGDDTVDYESSLHVVIVDDHAFIRGVVVDLTAGTATGEGTDTLANLEDVIGSYGDDTITGDANDNRLLGLWGDDAISGGDGNDFLFGLAGADTLDGGDGSDFLDGGAGTDVCSNGESNVYCESASSAVRSMEGNARPPFCLLAPSRAPGEGLWMSDRAGVWMLMGRQFRHAPTGSALASFTRVGVWALAMERFHCGANR